MEAGTSQHEKGATSANEVYYGERAGNRPCLRFDIMHMEQHMRKILLVAGIVFATIIPFSGAFADGYVEDTEPALKEKAVQSSDTSVDKASTAEQSTHSSASTGAGSGTPSLEKASGDDLAVAVGHYARARSLLIAAVQEFDKGYKLARPDALIDSKGWRTSVISKAEELEKILAPQPRVSRGGIKFDADTRLLKKDSK